MYLSNRVVNKQNISNSFRGILRVSPDNLGQDTGISDLIQVSDSIGNGIPMFVGKNSIKIDNLKLGGNTTLGGNNLRINSDIVEISVNDFSINTPDKSISLNGHIINLSGNIRENDIIIYKNGQFVISNLQDYIGGFVGANHVKPPVGSIFIYPLSNNIPDGYLLCDGKTYSRSAYPQLASALGSDYAGDNNTFRVPDFRNLFIKGATSENPPGFTEEPALPNIKGTFDSNVNDGSWAKTGAFYYDGQVFNGADGGASQWGGVVKFDASRSNKIYKDDVNDVIPRNISMNFIIKY